MKKVNFSLKLNKGRDIYLHLSMITLAIIGVLMTISASMSTNVISYDLAIQGLKQFGFVLIGYVAYLTFSKFIRIQALSKIVLPIMLLSLFSLILPLMGTARNGAYAWIDLPGGITIQPSEFAKLVMIWVNVIFLGDIKTKGKEASDLLQMPLIYFFSALFIIVFLQKDLGSAVVFMVIGVSTFLLAGHKKLRKLNTIVIILFILFMSLTPLLLSESGLAWIESTGLLKGYMLNRFKVAVNPFSDLYGSGYQLVNGLVAMVRGGLFGVGYGNGLQKYGYLPAAKTDYILAVIGEEIGFFGIMIVFTLYFVLFYRLLKHSFRAKTEKNKMILFGVFIYLSIHFILNVGGVTGFIPLTGVPLLLLSAGGSSTIAMMMACGMAQYAIVEESKKLDL